MGRKYGREHHPHKRQLAVRLATTAVRQAVGIYRSEQSAVSNQQSAVSGQLCAIGAGQTSPDLRPPSPNLGEGCFCLGSLVV